jgi:hypothetical protein
MVMKYNVGEVWGSDPITLFFPTTWLDPSAWGYMV